MVKEYYFSRKNKELAAVRALRESKGEPALISLGIGAPNGTMRRCRNVGRAIRCTRDILEMPDDMRATPNIVCQLKDRYAHGHILSF